MKTQLLVFFIVFSSLSGFCQSLDLEVIASAGKSSQNLNFQLDWTIGEVITTTISSEDYILSQGFHQPNLIISSIGLSDFPGLSVSIYPNPATEVVSVKLSSFGEDDRIIELIDMSGRICFYEQSNAQEIEINLLGFEKGLFFLRIHDSNGKHLGSFKIIKYGF